MNKVIAREVKEANKISAREGIKRYVLHLICKKFWKPRMVKMESSIIDVIFLPTM